MARQFEPVNKSLLARNLRRKGLPEEHYDTGYPGLSRWPSITVICNYALQFQKNPATNLLSLNLVTVGRK
jgi:hypothetical protein